MSTPVKHAQARLFFMAFLLCFLSVAQAGRSLYVNGFDTILGDVNKETALLEYAQSRQMDILLLYNLHLILVGDLTDPNTSLPLASFIEKAKRNTASNK